MRPVRSFLAVVSSLALVSAAAPALAAGCVAPSQAEVEQLHARWVLSLATLHPDKVLRNYAPDATFVGLESTRPLTELLAIRNYYVYFLQREPKVEIQERHVRTGCDAASDNGAMTMAARPKANAPHEPLSVRYSISYENRDGKWLIVNHHLSVAEPQPGAPPVAAAGPGAKAPAVAGFLKRLTTSKKRAAAKADPDRPATEQLQGGWTYTPGIWRPDTGPTYFGD